ncbi:thioredoxin family protein [Listeria ivanovii]|uniref:Thioredoxin family protein n=2 Tax=Listeria ivanovii TaxID=1638 RepID=A0ABS1G7C6_LISIV|nr:thioredoxin family protein [Listeria ivanovii]AIS60740.1 thioredoxin [Listeria ivanovii subsp. londoniensis]AIS63567.1 thioredoxin [Listeria ivanovii subsp. londoniensis]MBK1962774.1 thioredoxin family protein [Listeria ivanovii subsp. londoniensis]MBK1967543.1 thioredoxin family protein [Listeria ivanovii subsp. londoniensis]MBK1985729.1 thioredoxin family protein [Listeria ivanovii subsp. londoniensis]
MEIWEKETLQTAQKNGADFVIFFFTPMCGSCQMASRLVDMTQTTDSIDTTIAKVDLNYVPEFAQALEITSVPALVKFKAGIPVDVSYKLHDITAIFEFLYSK